PQQLDQRLGRDNVAAVEAEESEDGPGFGARDGDACALAAGLERAEHPQLGAGPRWGSSHGKAAVSCSALRSIACHPKVAAVTVASETSVRARSTSASVPDSTSMRAHSTWLRACQNGATVLVSQV